MNIRNVTVIGGSGFLGRHLARILAERGIAVRIPTRFRERAKRGLIILPTVEVVEANVHANADLEKMIAGADAVVSLAGILHESRRGDFERAHVELPRRVAETCKRAGVGRLIHVSALAADARGPSRYLRSKGEGEAAVRDAAANGPAVTLFRPSVIFGLGDSFLTLFARLLACMPVVILGSPHARFQPVWVEDVARALAQALDQRDSFGQTYELCGPTVYTLRELIDLTGKVTGHPRPVIALGPRLSYLQALVMEVLPGPLLTRDNVRSMRVDNVCSCAWPELFGFAPAALEAVLPTYLEGGPRSHYGIFRARAGR
jgi:NADH dehydrogenase